MIQDVYCGSRIQDPDIFHPVSRIRIFSIPDPGVKKAPGSRIRIRDTAQNKHTYTQSS
jgi:hypothetical protein